MSQPPQGPPDPGQQPRPPASGWGGQGGWGPPSGQPPQVPPPWGPPRYGPPGSPGQPPYGQPPYGQPGYGPPPGWGAPRVPPRRARRGPGVGLAVLAVAALALVLLLTPGFGSTRLDPDAVEQDVAGQYEELRGVPLALRCTEPMPVDEGSSYRCEGTTGDGDQVTVTIEVTGADGAYTWSDE